MSIYTLHRQVRQLDKTFCGNGRKYSTGDVLFSGQGKRIVLGQYTKDRSLPFICHQKRLSLPSSIIQRNGCVGESRSFG